MFIKIGMLWVLLIVAILFFAVSASDLVSYYFELDRFVFGTEVAGFTYATSRNFVLSNVAQVLVSLSVVAIAVFKLVHLYNSRG